MLSVSQGELTFYEKIYKPYREGILETKVEGKEKNLCGGKKEKASWLRKSGVWFDGFCVVLV